MSQEDLAPGYDRALAHIMAMDDVAIAKVYLELFPDNIYQQLLFVSWVRSIQDRGRWDRSPDTYPVNLVSSPGEGKSTTVREFAEGMGHWLTKIAGEPTKFLLVTRSLASINDLSEILGYGHIDHAAGVSRIFPHATLPSGDARVFGSLYLDD